jgi:hypothetical protein
MNEANGKTRIENARSAAKIISALKDKIDVIKKYEIGINNERASKENYDLILISEFENFEDLEKYQTHPEHIKVVEFLKTIRIKKAAVDFEVS